MESEKKCKYAEDNEFDNIEKLNEQSDTKGNYTFVMNLHHNSLQKMAIYKQTNDQKLRDEIILENMNLVDYVIHKFFSFLDIDEQELKSYGYEGLIVALESYNFNYNLAFSTYAISRIKIYIARGVSEILLGKKSSFYIDALTAKSTVEKKAGVTILDNPNLIKDIIELLVFSDKLGDNIFSIKAARRKIISLFIGNVSLNDENLINSDYLKYDDEFTDDILNSMIKDKALKLLDVLSDREKNILKLWFGLYNEESKTLAEIASIYNISEARVGQIKEVAIKRLRKCLNSRFFNSNISSFK